jgi:hypothetical protein
MFHILVVYLMTEAQPPSERHFNKVLGNGGSSMHVSVTHHQHKPVHFMAWTLSFCFINYILFPKKLLSLIIQHLSLSIVTREQAG